MDEQKLIFKACGSDSFTKGLMDRYAKIRPIDKTFAIGSLLTYTFCKVCGEVALIKVNKPNKF